jgi:hypothetical protein
LNAEIRSHRIAKLSLAVGAIVLPLAGQAWGGTDTWIGAAGGNWSDGSKWSSSAPPASGDNAYLSNSFSGTQTVSYDYAAGAGITLSSVTVDATSGGAYVLSMATNSLTVNAGEFFGYFGAGVFNQSGGVNNIIQDGAALYLGYTPGASGTYSLSSSGALNSVDEFVGYDGIGTFNQSGGSNTLDSSGSLTLGNTGTGTYTLGSSAALSAGNEYIGNSGMGNFNQTGGSNSFGSLILATNAGASGSYTLSGGNVSAVGNEYIGYAATGTFNQTGGTNTMTGFNGLYLGPFAGGTGSYLLGSGAALFADVEYIGELGSGTFTQSGGTNTIGGSGSTLTVGANPGSIGSYLLSGGILNSQTEYIGNGGAGSFNQTGGTNALLGGTTLYVGVFNTGTYTLGTGASLVGNTEYVGYQSHGNFNQTGGTNILSGASNLLLGFNSGSTGAYSVTGGTLSVGGTVAIGGSTSAPGGVGALTVDPGAQFTAGTLLVWNHGKVTLNGGSSTVNSVQIFGGLIDLTTAALTINYGTSPSPNLSIRDYISIAYNVSGTLWSGTMGITSSSASSNPAHRSVAFASGDDGVVTNLPAGISSAVPNGGALPAGVELITSAFPGDANLDGKVDFNDFLAISTHFLQSDIDWDHGNFNYDGVVNFNDFVVLATNFGEGVTGGNGVGATAQELAQFNGMAETLGASKSQIATWDATIANLPEPTSAALLMIGATLLLRRRSRAVG